MRLPISREGYIIVMRDCLSGDTKYYDIRHINRQAFAQGIRILNVWGIMIQDFMIPFGCDIDWNNGQEISRNFIICV